MPAEFLFSHVVGTFSLAGYQIFEGSQEAPGSTSYPTFIDRNVTFELVCQCGERNDCAIKRKKRRNTSRRHQCARGESQVTGTNSPSTDGLWAVCAIHRRDDKRKYRCPHPVWTPPRTGTTFTMTGSTPADMVRKMTGIVPPHFIHVFFPWWSDLHSELLFLLSLL